ncbi:expressed unknown protein [Seminavis robusta]|uniref:Cupin 2 conserved barrel domain-containing protein n=1 Tax=Seminavis robusta TaxID=568900 RepID=A0A9N8DMX2_9STRA|nr:expressed unknown protein [Seminavis robusta]|eukprot:Sro168_g074670.1 n/a (288) ;mRNA; f:9353-10449
MTLPLLISMVVAAVSAVFPPKSDSSSTTSNSQSSSGYSISPIFETGNRALFTGIALGIGFSWFLNHELERSRLHDRIRLAIQDLFRPIVATDGRNNDKAPMSGQTFPVLQNDKRNGANGEHQMPDGNTAVKPVTTIISTNNALTSTLWVSTICIPPQHELKIQKANGLEFFHVLQGKGKWATQEPSNEGSDNIADISPGDAFVVEANSTRWVSNGSSSEELILLRSSDAGHRHRQPGYDQIVPTSTSSSASSAARQLSSAVTSSYRQAGAYFQSLLGNTTTTTSSGA